MRSVIKYMALMLSGVLIAGCGGANSIQVNLQCSKDCNEGNVIVIRIYQLKNAEKFKLASMESLIRRPEETLAEDLIPNSKFEKILAPDETFEVESLEIMSGAQYLGIIGDFHAPAKDSWQFVVPLANGADDLKILVKENSLVVETD